MIRLRL